MSTSKDVRSQLDNFLTCGGVVTPDQLADKCSTLLSIVTNVMEVAICDEVKQYAQEQNRTLTIDTDSLTFSLDGVVYVIRMLEDPQDNFVLWITLTQSNAVESKTRTICRGTDLGDSGPYRKLRVKTDQTLADLASRLSAISKETLSAGAQAIEAYAMKQLMAHRDEFVEHLYLLLTRPFRAEIRKDLYLYIICPEAGGGIVMDSLARQESLRKLRNARHSLPRSPIELLCQVLDAHFPFEQTVAREIVPMMRTYECSPLSIPSAARVGTIQRILFDDRSMVLQPLARGDYVWVEAAYPPKLRAIVEKTLQQELEIFRTTVKNFESRGVANFWGSKSKSEITERVGSLMGSLIGSFLKFYE
jgi:hypothetical protein